jgi:uncharacterized protein (DUF927 family)
MKDFFKKILPEGLVVVAYPNPSKKGFTQKVCRTYDGADAYISRLGSSDKDIFFALGSLKHEYVLKEGRKRVRIKENILELKSFFLDLDVGDAPQKYKTQDEAIQSINSFTELNNLPKPMLVSSGRGLHVYWPLQKVVPADRWAATASVFKRCLDANGIKADPSVTSDFTSLLRVPGTINHKDGSKVAIIQDADPISGSEFAKKIIEMAGTLSIKTSLPDIGGSPPHDLIKDLGSNLDQTHDFPPAYFDRIKVACNQVKRMIVTGCETEPIWYAGLSLVKATTDPEESAIEISKNHPKFDEFETRRKLLSATQSSTGPTTCDRFRSLNPKSCEGCKYEITSPISLGFVPQTPPPAKDIPIGLPYPYIPGPEGKGVAMQGQERVLICPFDIYPKRRVDDESTGASSTLWNFRMPETGKFKEIEIPQGLLADSRALHRRLLEKNIPINTIQLPKMVNFMIAYVKKLQEESQLEQKFSRLGWRDEDRSFVLGDTIYRRDGTKIKHHVSENILRAVPGLTTHGTLAGWVDAMQFYNTPGQERFRFVLYAAMASIIYHMTGHAGALCFLTGQSGHGKTTVLRAANSIYGHPSKMGINGTTTGSTENALYGMLGVYNNIPMCLDDMSHWKADIFSRFALSISQGSGKRRSTQTGMISQIFDCWSMIAFASGNSNAYTTLATLRSDSVAEAMRVFQIDMDLPGTYTVAQGNLFANHTLYENYGVAAHSFVPWVAKNYDKISKVLQSNMGMITEKAKATHAERYWSSILAAAATAGSSCRHIGLFPDFPIEDDIKWAIDYMKSTRHQVQDNTTTPFELLSEYLDSHLAETLTVSTNRAGRVRVDATPRLDLNIRHDLTKKQAWINRTSFRQYCAERGCNAREVIKTLQKAFVIIEEGKLKTLSKGVDEYMNGQVRTIVVDLDRLSEHSD